MSSAIWKVRPNYTNAQESLWRRKGSRNNIGTELVLTVEYKTQIEIMDGYLDESYILAKQTLEGNLKFVLPLGEDSSYNTEFQS